MGVNIYYDPATLCAPSGKLREYRIRYTIEKDGVRTNYDLLFPTDILTWVQQGYITNEQLNEQVFQIVDWAVRLRWGV